MLWNQLDWTTISTGVGVVAAIGVWGEKRWTALKKVDPSLIKDIPRGVVNIADDIAHVIGGLAKTPFFASLAAKGKLEVHHVEAKLVDSELAKVAAQTLQSFGNDYANLSANQKSAAVIIARDAFSALHVTVTDAQIESALTLASQAVKDIQATQIYQAVAKLEQAKTTNSTSDSPTSDGQVTQTTAS